MHEEALHKNTFEAVFSLSLLSRDCHRCFADLFADIQCDRIFLRNATHTHMHRPAGYSIPTIPTTSLAITRHEHVNEKRNV